MTTTAMKLFNVFMCTHICMAVNIYLGMEFLGHNVSTYSALIDAAFSEVVLICTPANSV